MPRYDGRTTQDSSTNNFGGLNTVSSVYNGKSNEASAISNWDVDLSGAITRRLGHATRYSFGSDTRHLNSFFKLDGTQVFVAVSGGNLYESTSPSGPWTNRGAALTAPDFTYIGTDLNGRYVLCNGVDKPVVFDPGNAVQTLEDASLLNPPSNLSAISVGGAGKLYKYVITSSTPRGESLPSSVIEVFNGALTLSTTAYNVLSFSPVEGAFSQTIYRWDSSTGDYYRIAVVAGTVNTYTDSGATADATKTPPTVNGSYNTPEDWNTNGQPEGVFVVARGLNQRMMAWRKSKYWFSALSNIYDWYTENNSFDGQIYGGQDNNISAVTTLYDYTLIFSTTNCFVHTGSTYADFSLTKILKTGCPSHKSIVFTGDRCIIWSQFGPTTVDRVLAGQDIQTNAIGTKITPTIYDETNVDQWSKIVAWHDLKNHRFGFAVPGVGETRNTLCLLFNYQTQGWTVFDDWNIEDVTYDPSNLTNYAILDGDDIVELHTGNTDSGTRIDNVYQTLFTDFRTDLKKRMLMLDVFIDPSDEYEIETHVQIGYDSTAVETHTFAFDGTTATTDGQVITEPGNLSNVHRVPIVGCVDSIRLRFEDVCTADCRPRILGWRVDARVKGIR